MRKIDKLKTFQLILFILLTVLCFMVVFSNSKLFHTIALDKNVRMMCALLWASLGLSFLFIFMDFSMYSSMKRDYRELDYAVHTDVVSGLANRYSSDMLIEKYLDQPLPDGIGIIMLELSNIRQINEQFGHARGNEALHNFGSILKMASVDLCFVARNGGNRYLAVFEDGDREKIDEFLDRIERRTVQHNADSGGYDLVYRAGVGFHEGENIHTITDLISLAYRRMLDAAQDADTEKQHG